MMGQTYYKLYFKRAPGGKGKTKPQEPQLMRSDIDNIMINLSVMSQTKSPLSFWYDLYINGLKVDVDKWWTEL